MAVPQENAHKAPCNLLRDFIEIHALARAGWALDGKSVPIICVVVHQSAEDEHVHWHPDRSTPVGVATKHSSIRLGGQVRYVVFPFAETEHIWMGGMVTRERADAIGTKKLIFVQHDRQDATEFVLVQYREQSTATNSDSSRIMKSSTQFATNINERLKALGDGRVLQEQLRLEGCRCTKGE